MLGKFIVPAGSCVSSGALVAAGAGTIAPACTGWGVSGDAGVVGAGVWGAGVCGAGVAGVGVAGAGTAAAGAGAAGVGAWTAGVGIGVAGAGVVGAGTGAAAAGAGDAGLGVGVAGAGVGVGVSGVGVAGVGTAVTGAELGTATLFVRGSSGTGRAVVGGWGAGTDGTAPAALVAELRSALVAAISTVPSRAWRKACRKSSSRLVAAEAPAALLVGVAGSAEAGADCAAKPRLASRRTPNLRLRAAGKLQSPSFNLRKSVEAQAANQPCWR